MANFRLAHDVGIALKLKASIQRMSKSYPKAWNGKVKYHVYCADEVEEGWAIKAQHNGHTFSIAFTGVPFDKVKVYAGNGNLIYPGNVAPNSHDRKVFASSEIDTAAKYILTLLESFFKQV